MKEYTHLLTIVVTNDAVRDGNGECVDNCIDGPASGAVSWAFDPNRLNMPLRGRKEENRLKFN